MGDAPAVDARRRSEGRHRRPLESLGKEGVPYGRNGVPVLGGEVSDDRPDKPCIEELAQALLRCPRGLEVQGNDI
jgi:hypothetical protein